MHYLTLLTQESITNLRLKQVFTDGIGIEISKDKILAHLDAI